MKRLGLILIFSIFLSLSFFLRINSSADINIIYPRKNGATINATSTFFVGSADPNKKLYVNSEEVKVSQNGAFAHYVKLDKNGVNKFTIKSGDDEIVEFSIIKPQKAKSSTPATQIKQPILNEFTNTEYLVTSETPLRSTDFDGGINRLAQLPEGTRLLVNGIRGKFARVYLDKNTFGWVALKNIEKTAEQYTEPIELLGYEFSEDKEYYTYAFALSNRAPFTIWETEKDLTFTIYNINKTNETTQIKYSTDTNLKGYQYFYDENNLILKIRKDNFKVKKPIVVIDAGHGGKEKGAIGCCGAFEKDINLAISKLVAENLKHNGIKVLMTRENDDTVPLNVRTKFAQEHNAQILVSIHSNSLPDGQNPLLNKGTSVYFYHPQAKTLAETILNEVVTQAQTNNDKVRQRSLALVRPTSCLSVLVEVGYMINPDDYSLLVDADFQKACAKAIADGIINYLKN